MELKSNLIFIIFPILFIFNYSVAKSQDTLPVLGNLKDDISYVVKVKQYPPTDGNKNKLPFFKRFTQIIIGETPNTLVKPFNVLAKSTDDFWVLDQAEGKIINISEDAVSTPRFLSRKFVGFNSLVGICSGGDNKILFTDSYLQNIYIINTDKKSLTLLNDSLKLLRPTGIAYSFVNKQIWVVETGAHRITVLNQDGKVIKRIGKRGSGVGEFNFPTFICIDKAGDVYVVDSMNFRVQIFNAQGEFISAFGKIGDATGYFARPKGIAVDSYGNIYVADALFHVVQIFDKSGHFLYKFGGQGSGDEQFWMPTGIYIDEKDFIYIADSYNNRIQVFRLAHDNLKKNSTKE